MELGHDGVKKVNPAKCSIYANLTCKNNAAVVWTMQRGK